MKELKTLSGDVTFIIDDEDYNKVMRYNWGITANGYIANTSKILKRYLHRYILGLSRGDCYQIDHINGNKLDNRKENLRICSFALNNANKGKQKNGSSKYKGVSWHSQNNKWRVHIMFKGRFISGGCYDNEEIAAKKANALYIKYYGNQIKLNEIN